MVWASCGFLKGNTVSIKSTPSSDAPSRTTSRWSFGRSDQAPSSSDFRREDDVSVPAARDGGGPGSAGGFAGFDREAHVINESEESKAPEWYIRLCHAWDACLRFVCDGGISLLSGEKLVEMCEQVYDSEDLLHEILAKYPDLLAGEQHAGHCP